MTGKNTAVFSIYTDRSSVDRAVEGLKAAGFSNNDVSALFPRKQRHEGFRPPEEYQGTRRGDDRRWYWSGAGRWARLAGRNWRTGDPWPRTLHCCWPNYGGAGWSGSRRRGRGSYRRTDRHGDTGIRGQTL